MTLDEQKLLKDIFDASKNYIDLYKKILIFVILCNYK